VGPQQERIAVMSAKKSNYKILTSSEAIQRFGQAEKIARKHYHAKSLAISQHFANEMFLQIHKDNSLSLDELSPISSLAHNTISRRGRWGDPVQTASDIAQTVCIKLIEKKHKWPNDLPFKVLLARIVTCTALDTIKKNYRHYRHRIHDGITSDSLEATDILTSAIDHKIIPEHAYNRLMAEVLNHIRQMSPIEQLVAQKRIMNIQTLSGRQFADLQQMSAPWASGHYSNVKENLELYILALELGICH
jgi:hypothetical protein